MIRLFIALRPSAGFREALAALQESLRAAGVTGRFADPSNLHLTLAFIGMMPGPEPLLPLLPRAEKPFSLVLSHPGIFPEADVLWAGVQPSAALEELAGRVRQNLADAGIRFDPRPFVPHITLARKPRVPEGMDLGSFPVPPAEMTVRQVCLYRSEREDGGMRYTVIGSTENETEGTL